MTIKQSIRHYRNKLAGIIQNEPVSADSIYAANLCVNRINRLKIMLTMPIDMRYAIGENFGKNTARKSKLSFFADFSMKIHNGITAAIISMKYAIPDRMQTINELIESRLKYAKVTRSGQSGIVTYVDNETGKAYMMHGDHYYGAGLIKPLVEDMRPFEFEKWCSGMDV